MTYGRVNTGEDLKVAFRHFSVQREFPPQYRLHCGRGEGDGSNDEIDSRTKYKPRRDIGMHVTYQTELRILGMDVQRRLSTTDIISSTAAHHQTRRVMLHLPLDVCSKYFY